MIKSERYAIDSVFVAFLDFKLSLYPQCVCNLLKTEYLGNKKPALMCRFIQLVLANTLLQGV